MEMHLLQKQCKVIKQPVQILPLHEIVQHHLFEESLIIRQWLVADDVWHLILQQHRADVLVLEFDGAFAPLIQFRQQLTPIRCFVVGLSMNLPIQHLEIGVEGVGDFVVGPGGHKR